MQANQLNATQFNREHVFHEFEGLWSFSWQREDEQIGSLEVGDYFQRRPERCEEWKEIHYKYRNTLQIQKYTTNTEILYKSRNTLQIQKYSTNTRLLVIWSEGRSGCEELPGSVLADHRSSKRLPTECCTFAFAWVVSTRVGGFLDWRLMGGESFGMISHGMVEGSQVPQSTLRSQLENR